MASEVSTFTTPIADAPLARRFSPAWRLALLAAGGLVGVLGLTLAVSWVMGVGSWGVNIPFVWGFDLTNYAWWIGIANGASGQCTLRI